MTEPATSPSPPLRTWRPMAAWTAGMLLAVGLAWFVGAAVVPFYRAKKCLEDGSADTLGDLAVTQLGGPNEAVRGLVIYYRMPKSVAPRKDNAVWLLGRCADTGRSSDAALATLRAALRDKSAMVRLFAAERLDGCDDAASHDERARVLAELAGVEAFSVQEWSRTKARAAIAFGRMRPVDQRAVAALESVLCVAGLFGGASTASEIRERALGVLAEMGPEASAAVPAIEGLLKSPCLSERQAAASALKKIRGDEAKP